MRAFLGLIPLLFLIACEGRRDLGNVLAKIGKDRYYESDLEKLTRTLAPKRREEVLNDPEERRKYFSQVLEKRLLAFAAKDAGFADDRALRKRLELNNLRLITQHYYEYFLGENAGFADEEIKAFFKTHPGMFQDDSGKTLDFADAKKQVVDSLILSKANLDSFYREHESEYERKAGCEVSYIRVTSGKDAEKAARQLDKGSDFEQVAKEFDLAQRLRSGRVTQGETHWELGSAYNWDSLFFHESGKLPSGSHSGIIPKDEEFLIVRPDSCQPHVRPGLEEVRSRVAEEYLRAYRSRLTENALAELKARYEVKIVDMDKSADERTLKTYYERNKEIYQSPATYDVLHIESGKKEAASARLAGVKDAEGFRAAAGEISTNSWTAKKKGAAGIIKRDHCLPYGIGMLPSLFPALDSMDPGSLAGPFHNPETGKWHWFWLVRKFPKQPKPYERAAFIVRQDYEADRTREVAPEDTLATYAGGAVIRESDVLFLAEEVPPHLRARYTRDQLLDYLLTWELASLEAKRLGLAGDAKLQASLLDNEDSYWANVYRDSVVQKTYALDTNLLKRTFEENRAYFTRDTGMVEYGRYVREIAGFLALDSGDFKLEYHINPERYTRKDTLIPLDSARYEIFQSLKNEAYERAEEDMIERLKRKFEVVLVDETLKEPRIGDPQAVFKEAQNLHYDRKLDKALALYRRLRNQFPDNASLQDSVAFGMAQIFIEQELYQKALAEYRRVSYLYPDSPNEYKARFMIGFIQAEHLKKDSAAVRTFRAMLKKYPESDLSDDADWMIRNIESGGALMPVLEDEGAFDTTGVEQGEDKASRAKDVQTTASGGGQAANAKKGE